MIYQVICNIILKLYFYKNIIDNLGNLSINLEGIDSTSYETKSLSPPLLTNRINYVLLAVIVNILLILQLDHLFGKVIIDTYQKLKFLEFCCTNKYWIKYYRQSQYHTF